MRLQTYFDFDGFSFQGKTESLAKLLLFFCVSLALGLTKVVAQDSVEISSPEESVENSLPSFGLIPRRSVTSFDIAGPLDLGVFETALENDPELAGAMMAHPLLVEGLFPVKVQTFKIDPLSTFLAAAIAISVQSLKETGQVNPDAILRLLNSTDLWAGVIGTGVGAYTKQGVDLGLEKLMSKMAPHTVASLSNQTLLKLLGNLVSGLTYTVAVSSGFEYFSQFWKLCTEGVENVSTVSDFANAEWKDINPVIQNFRNYFLDASLQKRILASIRDNRIMTFEFLATNAALYVGLTVGNLIAQSIGPETPVGFKQIWAKRLKQYFARILGGVGAAVAVQFVPDGVRISVNKGIMNWMIGRKVKSLERYLDQLQYGIAYELYPTRDVAGLVSFFGPNFDLLTDVDRVSRMLDSLNSMYMKQFFVYGKENQAFEGIQSSFRSVNFRLQSLMESLGGDDWIIEDHSKLSPIEIGRLAERTTGLSETDKYYIQVLSAESRRFDRERQKLFSFINQMTEFRAEFRDESFQILELQED